VKHDGLGILGIDVGTSSLKAVAFNGTGEIQALSRVAYTYAIPQSGWAEIDPETWWLALKKALLDLESQDIQLKKLSAVSFTGQMHTGVLLDQENVPISPAILWLDRRAAGETEELRQKLNLPPYQLNSTYTLPKLLWMHRHRPELMEKAKRILWPKDYLRWRFTGEICTDETDAIGSGLYDWEGKCWDPERVKMLGWAPEVLPPIRPSNADGGTVLSSVAEELGLNPNLKVVIGMGDMAALLGGAPLKEGRVVCSLGSSSMIFTRLFDHRNVSAPDHSLYSLRMGSFHLFGGVSSITGAALDWLYEQVYGGRERHIPFESFIHAALDVKPGAEGLVFLPYLAGERSPYWSDQITGGFTGLKISHDMRHLTRAVLEGVAFSLRHILDLFRESGVPVTELALAAGGVRTPGWAQIMADVCQMDVFIYTGQETVTRVLFAACMDYLEQADFEEILTASFDQPRVICCRPELSGVYEENYQKYRQFSRFAAANASK